MKILTALALAVSLTGAACAPNEPRTTIADEASDAYRPPAASPAEETACAAAGGDWRREGMLGSWMCVMPHADAGRSCTDGSQCRGDCRLADDARPPQGGPVTGVCQADTSPFGCFTRVENGRAAATLCVD